MIGLKYHVDILISSPNIVTKCVILDKSLILSDLLVISKNGCLISLVSVKEGEFYHSIVTWSCCHCTYSCSSHRETQIISDREFKRQRHKVDAEDLCNSYILTASFTFTYFAIISVLFTTLFPVLSTELSTIQALI